MLAIVTRKSTRDDRQVSITRQEKLGRDWAAANMPDEPVTVFSDNAVSGMRMDRPGWVAFTEAVRKGRVAAVWAYEQSRLTRAGSATWDEVCVMLAVAGITEVHTHRQGRIGVAEGNRMLGRFQAVMDQEEREVARIRVLDALQDLAEQGRPSGALGYGYRRITEADGKTNLEPDPRTAPIVERIVHEIAAGDSLGLVAARLNEEGVPTLRGKEWRPGTVRALVRAPRIVGLRVHQGQVIGQAQWPGIVDRKTWERAQARIASHKPGRTASHRRRYLLTGGLVICDGCEQSLISSTTPTPDGPAPSYQCPHKTRTKGKSCGKCSILADRLEEYVVERITEQLADPEFAAALNDYLRAGAVDTTPIHDELERIEGRLADLAVVWASGDFIEIEHATARRTLLEERAKLMGQLAQTPVEEYTVDDVLDAWAAGGIARRPLIPVLCEPIRVAGAFRDGRRLTVEERVKVKFL